MSAPTFVDEQRLRDSAIEYVLTKASAAGGVVTRPELEAFTYQGVRITLIDQGRGIRNPRQLAGTLTILSTEGSPYEDARTDDGLIRYNYRTGPADGGDNRKLRAAAALGLPVILLKGIADGIFVPVAPVYLVRDLPERRCVEVAIDEGLRFFAANPTHDQRSYIERLMKVRLHQPIFRAEVIRAYSRQCAMCRLRHPELLDAAHILPDSHVNGLPVVPNGLALCKIHHAAYDRNIVGIRPDLVVEIQPKVLAEIDGPMLLHGLQEMKGVRITVPRARHSQPDPVRLEERYEAFRAAG